MALTWKVQNATTVRVTKIDTWHDPVMCVITNEKSAMRSSDQWQHARSTSSNIVITGSMHCTCADRAPLLGRPSPGYSALGGTWVRTTTGFRVVCVNVISESTILYPSPLPLPDPLPLISSMSSFPSATTGNYVIRNYETQGQKVNILHRIRNVMSELYWLQCQKSIALKVKIYWLQHYYLC